MKKLAMLIISSACFLTAPARADEVTTADLPFELFKFEGSQLYAKKQAKYAKYKLENNVEAKGRVLTYVYTLAGDHTPLEIGENYKQSLAEQGFELHFERESTRPGSICGNPDLDDVCAPSPQYNDTYFLEMKKAAPEGDSYVHVIAAQSREGFKAKSRAASLPEMVVEPGGHAIILRVVVPASLKKQMVKESAATILEKLKTDGKIDLYGIYFDTDKADIKPQSAPVLSEIVKAMQEDPNIKLLIGGHTDNVGSADHNIDLSLRRAAAVVKALVAQGIAKERLDAKGYGDSRPVADNATEEGRAKNRRVELSKTT